MSRPPTLSFPLRRAVLAGAGVALLGACVDRRLRGATSVGPLEEATPRLQDAGSKGPNLGAGSVKVALILPLSGGGQGAAAGASLRNAAELSLAEFQGADLLILVKDDRGTAEGAREAATAALADGAELVLGPLFAPAVSGAGAVARGAGKPVVAFSTDVSVAGRGVYLLSFTPGSEVDRVVDHAASQGRRSIATLIPDTTYGNVVEGAFRETAARSGVRVAALERYPAGQIGTVIPRVSAVVAGGSPTADALFLPEAGDALASASASLVAAGFDPGRVKLLGTGVWNDPRTAKLPALQGGWYAAPDQGGFASFAGRYRARFGAEPTRVATLAYDAVSLAAALAKTAGAARFSDATLQGSAGFSGVDGTFRFRADGTSERALAVLEIRNEGTTVVSPAPRSFA